MQHLPTGHPQPYRNPKLLPRILLRMYFGVVRCGVCAAITARGCSLVGDTEQSRRCPLCSQAIGLYIIHSIRSRYDFRKHYLTPLRTSPEPMQEPARLAQEAGIRRRRAARVRDRDIRMREEREESDKLERSIAKRRWLYQQHLYAKVRRFCFLIRHLPLPFRRSSRGTSALLDIWLDYRFGLLA
jgi:hypothetical protein